MGDIGYKFKPGTTEKTYENLAKSNLVPMAFYEVFIHEFGDKTFLLLIIFCIIY